MKKNLLLFISMVVLATSAIGQNNHARYLDGMFPGIQSMKRTKAVSSETKMRLDSSVCQSSYKDEYIYNSKNLVYINNKYNWNSENSTWTLDTKCKFSYSDNEDTCVYKIYSLNSSTKKIEFEEMYKIDFSVNNNGSIATRTYYYSYDTVNPSWSIMLKAEYYYNNDGNDTACLSYEWENNAWALDSKSVYTYDSNGNCTTYAIYRPNNSSWTPDYKYEYSYNTSYNAENIIMPNVAFCMKNMITSIKYYQYSNASWAYQFENTLYYSSQTTEATGVNTPACGSKLNAYLKDGQLQVSGLEIGENITVYNLQGVRVYNQKATSNYTNILLPDNGLYILSNGKQTIKIIRK
jgi:hypothetical protein